MISISWGFRWNLVADLSHFLWGMFWKHALLPWWIMMLPLATIIWDIPRIRRPFLAFFCNMFGTSTGQASGSHVWSLQHPFFRLFFVDFWQVLGRWRDEGDGEAPGIFRLGRNTGVVVSEKGGERGIHIDWPPTLAIFLENMTVCSKGMTMDDRHGNIGQEKISKIRCLDEFWAVNLGLQPTNYADWSCKHGDGTWAWSWYRGRPRSMWMFIAITLNEHGGSAPSGMTFFETIEVILLFGCKNNGF